MSYYNDPIIVAIIKAKDGVDYDGGKAACPFCGFKLKVYDTKPWRDGQRVRYNICKNKKCAIHVLNCESNGIPIKTIETRRRKDDKKG